MPNALDDLSRIAADRETAGWATTLARDLSPAYVDPVSREEYAVWLFLSENPESAFSRREIARRAVKRAVFEQNPNWANEALSALVARGVIELDEQGCYRLKRAHTG